MKTSSFRVEPSRLMGDLTPSISSSSMIPRRLRRSADLDFPSGPPSRMHSLAPTHLTRALTRGVNRTRARRRARTTNGSRPKVDAARACARARERTRLSPRFRAFESTRRPAARREPVYGRSLVRCLADAAFSHAYTRVHFYSRACGDRS